MASHLLCLPSCYCEHNCVACLIWKARGKGRTMNNNHHFTKQDIDNLEAYVKERQAIDTFRDSIKLTTEEWIYILDTWTESKTIPAKYADRIGQRDIIVYSGIENGQHKLYPEGVTQLSLYDKLEEEKMLEYIALHGDPEEKYRDSINKLIVNYKGEADEHGFLPSIDDMLLRLLEEPEIRKLLERKNIPAISSVPNGESINFFYKVLSSKGGRIPQASKKNRHEEIITERKKKDDILRVTRNNKQKESSISVTITQTESFLSKQNKTFAKVLTFVLEKMTAQHFESEVTFSLQEMVDRGMYSSVNNALRGAKSFFEQQKQTTLSGSIKVGRKTISQEGGVIFYHYKIKNGYVTFFVNDNFKPAFIANYFTVLPSFAYGLSNNAFLLVRYIFSIARQNVDSIRKKGSFTLSFNSIRENIGLPSVEEVKNRKYKQFIIEPIEKAIEEIEDKLMTLEEAKDCAFTITPYGTDTSNIMEWLQGYIEIGLKGDFSKTFVKLAEKTEEEIKAWEKAKRDILQSSTFI